MDADERRRIPLYTTSTLHFIVLGELAKLHPDPIGYLAELERKAIAMCDMQQVDGSYTETVKHGVAEGIGQTFATARAWLQNQSNFPTQ